LPDGAIARQLWLVTHVLQGPIGIGSIHTLLPGRTTFNETHIEKKEDLVIDVHAREGTLNKWENGGDKKSRQNTTQKKKKGKKKKKQVE
jgi:hypothetical protein